MGNVYFMGIIWNQPNSFNNANIKKYNMFNETVIFGLTLLAYVCR